MIRVAVLGPTEFARSCMVAGLATEAGLRAQSYAGPDSRVTPPPDVVLLQEPSDGRGGEWLVEQLDATASSWPDTVPIVLSSGNAAELQLCLAAGVQAYLSPYVEIERIVAAMHLVRSGLAVYPAQLLGTLGVLVRRPAGGAATRRGGAPGAAE